MGRVFAKYAKPYPDEYQYFINIGTGLNLGPGAILRPYDSNWPKALRIVHIQCLLAIPIPGRERID